MQLFVVWYIDTSTCGEQLMLIIIIIIIVHQEKACSKYICELCQKHRRGDMPVQIDRFHPQSTHESGAGELRSSVPGHITSFPELTQIDGMAVLHFNELLHLTHINIYFCFGNNIFLWTVTYKWYYDSSRIATRDLFDMHSSHIATRDLFEMRSRWVVWDNQVMWSTDNSFPHPVNYYFWRVVKN